MHPWMLVLNIEVINPRNQGTAFGKNTYNVEGSFTLERVIFRNEKVSFKIRYICLNMEITILRDLKESV